MAFSVVAARGTGTSSTSSSTLNCTPNATIATGRFALLTIAADNTSTADGDNGEVTGVADTAGNLWFKCGEYTNGNGTAATGVTVSVWGSVLATQLTTGSTITVTFGSNRTDKCCALHEISVATNYGVKIAQAANGNAADTATAFGSVSISPALSSAARLYWRGLAREVNIATDLTTVSTNFTTAGYTVRSRNNAAAVIARAEYRINTSTGETSAPSHTSSGDSAGILIAFEEVPPLALAQSGNTAMSATMGVSSSDFTYGAPAAGGFRSYLFPLPYGLGRPTTTHALAQSGATAMGGTMGVSGDITITPGSGGDKGFRSRVFPIPFGFGKATNVDFAFNPTNNVALTGTAGASGNIGVGVNLTQSGTLNLSATLGVSGDISSSTVQRGFRSRVFPLPFGFGRPGDNNPFAFTPTGALALSATTGASGDIQAIIPWDFEAPLELPGLTATLTIAGDISATGPRTGVIGPATISLTGAVTGTTRVTGSVAPSTLSLSGSVTGTANITGSVPASTLSLTGSATGTVRVAGVVDPATISLTGTITGTVADNGFEISENVAVDLGATLTVNGDIAIQSVNNGTITGTVSLTGTSAGQVRVTGVVSPTSITLTGSITGGGSNLNAAIAGTVSLTGSATGTTIVRGNAQGTIGLTGTSTGTVRLNGAVVSSTISLTGQVQAKLTIEGPPWRRYLKMQPALEMRTLTKNGTESIGIVLVASSSPWQGVPNAQNIVVKVSKAGGALQTVTPTITEIGEGVYLLQLTGSMLDTTGELVVTVTADGCIPISQLYMVDEPLADKVWAHRLALTVMKFLSLK